MLEKKNSIRSVDFYLAAAIAGIVRVPLYWRNSAPLILAMATNAECTSGIIDDDAGLDAMDPLAAELERTIVRDNTYESWLTQQSDLMPRVPITDDTLCLIRHTGGTTGSAKGITSTHRQWACIGRDVTSFKPRIGAGEVMLHVAPLSHASATTSCPHGPQERGRCCCPTRAPAQILETLSTHRVAHFFAPPTLVNMIVAAGSNSDTRLGELKPRDRLVADLEAIPGRRSCVPRRPSSLSDVRYE